MKFSIVMPVYNKADTICAALDSILLQTFKDYEIIIIDDGSSDNLNDAVNNYLSDNVHIIHQNNSGVSVARNNGIKNATGEYICFLDADDLWKPNHLSEMNHLITSFPDSNVFVTSHEVLLSNGTVINSTDFIKDYPETFETDNFLNLLNTTSYGIINTNSICVQRSVFISQNILFEPNVCIGEDSDVWYRLALKNKFAISKNRTTSYRREFSTATQNGTHVHNWIFASRIDSFLADAYIKDEVKTSAMQLIDRYKLTSSRVYMTERKRKEAKAILTEIKFRNNLRYFLTKAFTCLPFSLCRILLK